MDLIYCTLLVIVVVSLVTYLWTRRPDPRLPPFPPVRPLPIVGHLLTVLKNPRQNFKKWQEELGDIYSIYMGNSLAVVFCGYDLMKETFVKRAAEFSDRPAHVFFDQVGGLPHRGIMMTSGPVWKEQREVSMSILRSLGMGKNILAEHIQKEVKCFLKMLENFTGEGHKLKHMTTMSAANVICTIMIGRRFEYDDKAFIDLTAKVDDVASNLEYILTFLPWVKYLPGDLFGAKKIKASSGQLMKFIGGYIQEKRKYYQYDNYNEEKIDNVIVPYLYRIERKMKRGERTSNDEEQLARIMMDLLAAGSQSIAITVVSIIVYAIIYPDMQKKIFEEIKREIGVDRQPTMADKAKLIFVNAFIMEVQRIVDIAALGLFHTCPSDVTVRGYTIPKGTYIIPFFDSVLHDTTIWGEDPFTLRPERFIDENGKLKKMEEFVPYSLGKRVCMGEAIANMELFLYTTSMIQKYEFQALNPESLPALKSFHPETLNPDHVKIKTVKRNCDA